MQTILWPLCCTSKAMAELGMGGIGPSPSRSWLSGSARSIAAGIAREQMVRTVGSNTVASLLECLCMGSGG